MTKALCPCCGQPVAFSRKGAAILASQAAEAVAGLQEGIAVLPDGSGSPSAREALAVVGRDLVKFGEALRDFSVDHVHKRARPTTTPDLNYLRRRQNAWMVACTGYLRTVHLWLVQPAKVEADPDFKPLLRELRQTW